MRVLLGSWGWSGGAKVLGKLSVPGRPTGLDDSRARAYCACSRCGWGCLDIFSLVYLFSFLSPSLWETARYRLKYCLKGLLNPKQPTNQPTSRKVRFMQTENSSYDESSKTCSTTKSSGGNWTNGSVRGGCL